MKQLQSALPRSALAQWPRRPMTGPLWLFLLALLGFFYYYCQDVLTARERIDFSNDGKTTPHAGDVMDIDRAHLRGRRHRGCWLYIMNERGQFLLSRRSKRSVTCPHTWTPIGEHTHFRESYTGCAQRALEEELGIRSYLYLTPLAKQPSLIHLTYTDVHREDAQWNQAFLVVIKGDQSLRSTEAEELRWIDGTEIESWLSGCPDGKCRYCQPSDVWRMYQNETVVRYDSFLSMTLEHIQYVGKLYAELMNGGRNPLLLIATATAASASAGADASSNSTSSTY